MKKILLIIATISMFSSISQAAYYCEFVSDVGYGWAQSFNVRHAKRVARRNCNAYSRPYRCWFNGCERVWFSEEQAPLKNAVGGFEKN